MRAELADGRILEFPDGTDPSVIQATVKKVLGQAQAAPQQAAPAPQPQPQEPTGFPGAGVIEPAATIASGIVAEPVAGLVGLASLPFGAEQAERNIEATREALTFVPKTEAGMAGLETVGEVLQPVGEAVQAIEKGAGDIAFEATGSPVAGALATTTPSAALMALTGGVGRTAARLGKLPKTALTPDDTLLSALEKGTVLTTDVIPPKTFVGKAFQKISERIPVLGTGKIRAGQQAGRVEALDDIAREFDINPGSTFEADIVKSADTVFKNSQKRAGQLRLEAVTELNKSGNVAPVNAIKAIDAEIDKITALGARGDATLLKTLQDIKGEMAGNFERMKNIRTTLFEDISDIGVGKSPIRSGGDTTLGNVAGALSKDLDDYATNAGKVSGASRELQQAANKWKASNRIFKDNFAKAKDTVLKKTLTKGKVQPEVINTVIRGGKESELKILRGNIDNAGRKAVKQQIIKSALEKANGNPTIFINELKRTPNRKAIDIFFKGSDLRELNSVRKFLDITRRAQEEGASIASQAEVTTVGLIGGAAVAPKPVIAAATITGLLGRAYESKAVRNLLLRLSNLSPASKKAKDIANQISVLVAAEAQKTKEAKK